jgi:hypothetical protein
MGAESPKFADGAFSSTTRSEKPYKRVGRGFRFVENRFSCLTLESECSRGRERNAGGRSGSGNEEGCIRRADARNGPRAGRIRPAGYNPVELSRFAVGIHPLVFQLAGAFVRRAQGLSIMLQRPVLTSFPSSDQDLRSLRPSSFDQSPTRFSPSVRGLSAPPLTAVASRSPTDGYLPPLRSCPPPRTPAPPRRSSLPTPSGEARRSQSSDPRHTPGRRASE